MLTQHHRLDGLHSLLTGVRIIYVATYKLLSEELVQQRYLALVTTVPLLKMSAIYHPVHVPELGSFFSEHVKILSFTLPSQEQKVNRAGQPAVGEKELSHE